MSTKEIRKSLKQQPISEMTLLVRGWSDILIWETYFKIKERTGIGPQYLYTELKRRKLLVEENV